MNEFKFIIYDDENKIVDIQEDTLDEILNFDAVSLPCGYRYEVFNYIGLNDIDGKKIYADCSIVEFYYGNSLDDERLITGYFSFNSETLRYEIKDIKTKEAIFLWTGYIESGLSVIDTIQENKLGLIKDNKMRINTECEQCGAVINTKIKKMCHHLVDVKCPFCDNTVKYEIDKENGVEKKLNNYSKNVDKLHKKIDNQKNEIKTLQDKLNVANGIVFKQINEIKRLNNILYDKNEKFITEINKYEKHYENQLKVQDNELKRRLTIIHYLEEKLFRKDK